jgi:hypothetical protein
MVICPGRGTEKKPLAGCWKMIKISRIIDVESKKANQILHLESEKEYLAYLAWHPSARQISLSIETRKDNRF